MPESTYWLPMAERQTIKESIYLTSLNKAVKLLVANEKDEDSLVQYIADQFSRDEPIDAASGISPEQLAKRYRPTIQHSLKESFTLVVVDCFEVCALIVANRVKVGEKREGTFKDDYEKEITSSKADCLPSRQIQVFVDEFESFTPNYLPEDCREFYRIDLFSVLPKYRGTGLGKLLWLESLKVARRQKFQFVESGCSAKASTFIGTKLGMKIAYTFPYKQFLSNGQAVFGEVLKDGSTEANMLIGDLSEIFRNFEEGKSNLPSAYKLDQTVNRKLIEEFYAPKLGRNLRLEIATGSDHSIVKHFIAEEFFKQGPMFTTLQGNKEAHREICESMEKAYNSVSLNTDLTFIVTDNGHLCALVYNCPKCVEHGTPLNDDFKEDFTKEIDSAGCQTKQLSTLKAFIEWLQARVSQYVPSTCKEVFYIDTLSVHPEYRGCQLGQKLWTHSLKEAHKRGYTHAQAICTAVASTKIALNCKMEAAFTYPFESFKYQGKQVFPSGRLYEGCQKASLIIGDLQKIFK